MTTKAEKGKEKEKAADSTAAPKTGDAKGTDAATKEKASKAPRVGRTFEVLGAISIGRTRDKSGEVQRHVLTAGATVTEEKLLAAGVTAEDISDLIAKRQIADGDAPVPPSQAEGYAALEALADVAQQIGVLKRKGSEYRLGDQTFTGITAFRSGVSITQLKNAIVAKAKD
jgi:hypothetical protein